MASSPSKGRAPGPSGYSPVPGSPPGRSKSPTMPPSPTPPSPRPRPSASRTLTYTSAMSLGVPSTPFYTPQVSSVNVASPKRLLMPTVRSVRTPGPSPRSPPAKPSQSKLGRSRAGSLSVSVYPDTAERVVAGASDWLVGGEKFEVVEEQLELEGFQIYAVEKWYASWSRPSCL